MALQSLVEYSSSEEDEGDAMPEPVEAPQTCRASSSGSDDGEYEKFAHLLDMGFTEQDADKALRSCGTSTPIETLVTFLLIDDPDQAPNAALLADELLQPPRSTSEILELLQPPRSTSEILESFGYSRQRAEQAIAVCGNADDIDVLVDFMDAHDYATDEDEDEQEEEDAREVVGLSRKRAAPASTKRRKAAAHVRELEVKEFERGDMSGYGVPGRPSIRRYLTPKQARSPYFYFENVSSMPKGEWGIISRSLDNIEPEFVDARHFSVSRRARGYIHNLPTENRFQLLPIPPMTIKQFLPHTAPFTPAWDDRDKLSCINTINTFTSFCRQISDMLKDGEPPEHVKKQIMGLCRKWNLVWTAPGVVSQLEPHENERALGFPMYHTRGAITRTYQAKAIGNSFQVDTVGYHLSALKQEFGRKGIRVLSLFSGIGGAEVALHRAGIPLKFVVSVEASKECRKILETWWKTSGQTGKHILLDDVLELSKRKLEELIQLSGGFDLIIGGSPCNNLSGNNRTSRTGLEGQHSSLFYEFPKILGRVRDIMGCQQPTFLN